MDSIDSEFKSVHHNTWHKFRTLFATLPHAQPEHAPFIPIGIMSQSLPTVCVTPFSNFTHRTHSTLHNIAYRGERNDRTTNVNDECRCEAITAIAPQEN